MLFYFINSMIEESNFTDIMKKIVCWICDNFDVEGVAQVKDHFYITIKYRGSEHTVCNINFKLNHKFTVLFHNPKKNMIHIFICENLVNSILK